MLDKRKLQMSDIAKLAGVSTATVSRALNGSQAIRPETRERIQALAQAHQYTVHAGAKICGAAKTARWVWSFPTVTICPCN